MNPLMVVELGLMLLEAGKIAAEGPDVSPETKAAVRAKLADANIAWKEAGEPTS